VLHVLTYLDESAFRVGRGHDCDVRFKDISISRQHAIIRWHRPTQQWCLTDNQSKFGTVALAKRPVDVTR
jgi:pSer/pThr/pTyr-binding forkhead associated (FHA) protein